MCIKKIVLFFALTVGLYSCQSDSYTPNEDVLKDVDFTIDMEFIEPENKVILSGGIVLEGYSESDVIDYGFLYNYHSSFNSQGDFITIKGDGPLSNFVSKISYQPQSGHLVSYKAYVNIKGKIIYSKLNTQSLPGGRIKISTSSNFSDLTFERATVYGSCSVENPSLYPITERGFCYINTHKIQGRPPYITDGRIAVGAGDGDFSTTITGLEPAAAYKVRAYAINARGTHYAASYVTLPMHLQQAFVPFCSLTFFNDIITGTIFDDCDYYVTEKGFCYRTDGRNPTIDDNKITMGSGLGSFTLKPDFPAGKYYFRSYGINEAGCGYSPTVEIVLGFHPTISTLGRTNKLALPSLIEIVP